MSGNMEVRHLEQRRATGSLDPTPGSTLTRWLLMSLAFLSMGTLCLWMGAVMIVRCETIPPSGDDRTPGVRVTVERRLLGLIPVWKGVVSNVVGVGSPHGTAAQLRTNNIAGVLKLRLADGRTWNAPPAYAPIGTPPWKMARQIANFIDEPSPQPLTLWCMSWMLHLAAAPLLFVGLLAAYSGLRRFIILRSREQGS
jgi:hypothetical protein